MDYDIDVKVSAYPWRRWWLDGWIALCVAWFLTSLTLPDLSRWYSANPVLRWQTDAFFHGHTTLSPSPYSLTHDLVWDHGVQQVWGLGVPAFRFPFELVARVFGQRAFPDRITFLIACTLCYWFLIRTFTAPDSNTDFLDMPSANWKAMRIPWVLGMLLLAPPFVNLLHARFGVHEEVVAYGYLYSLTLFAGFLRVARHPAPAKLLWLALWAGFGAWIRPTLLFYGVVTVGLACVIAWRARVHVAVLGSMLLLFFLCGAGLGYSNMRRFGGFFEFGHSLNVENGLYWNTYSLKFDYPFRKEPLFSAVQDELGTLFFTRKLNGTDFYAPDVVWGQSPTPRWHEMYFPTFGASYLMLLIVGFMIWTLHFLRRWVAHDGVSGSPQLSAEKNGARLNSAFAIFAGPWAALSFLLLFGFYLWSPSMSSRYNVDFLAAVMIGISALIWIAFELNFFKKKLQAGGWFAIAGAWVAGSILAGRYSGFASPMAELGEIRSATDPSLSPRLLPELRHYELGGPDSSADIPFNCGGWDLGDGTVQPAVTLFASDPECVVLSVFNTEGTPIASGDIDPIRARIGLEYLARESVKLHSTNATIVFRGPRNPRYQRGLQVCFLAFIRTDELGQKTPPVSLSSVSFARSNFSAAASAPGAFPIGPPNRRVDGRYFAGWKRATVIGVANGGLSNSQELDSAVRTDVIAGHGAFEIPDMLPIPGRLPQKLDRIPGVSTRRCGETMTFVGSGMGGG